MKTIKPNIIQKLIQKLFYTKWTIQICGSPDGCNFYNTDEYVYAKENIKHVYLKHKPNAGDEINFYNKKGDDYYFFHIDDVDFDATINGYTNNQGVLRGTIFQ